MSSIFSCKCGQRVKANDSLAGKRVRCPACGDVINVPVSASSENSPAIAAPVRRQPLEREPESFPQSPPLDYNAPTSASASRVGVPPPNAGRRAVTRPDMVTILRLGLGPFFTIWGVIGILVCVMSLFHCVDRFRYALKSTPTVIDVSANGVSHNDYVQLTAALDFDNGLQVEKISGRAFTLIPVVGSNKRLIVYEKGHANLAGDTAQERTFTGRIVTQGFTEDWDLGVDRIELVYEFAREGLIVPEDALVLDASSRPNSLLAAMMMAIASTGALLWFAVRVVMTIQLLVDDDKLMKAVRTAR